MAQWVLAVAGIAILSVLCDIVLPNGVCRKYIKTVIGIVVTLVIAQPLFSLFSGKGFLAEYRNKQQELSPQESYLSYLDMVKDADVLEVKKALISADFALPSVTFSAKAGQYVISMQEKYTPERESRAKSAVTSVNAKFSAVFIWNNTE